MKTPNQDAEIIALVRAIHKRLLENPALWKTAMHEALRIKWAQQEARRRVTGN